MTGQKQVRLSLARLGKLLERRGPLADPRTVRRLLVTHGCSLKANRKRSTGLPLAFAPISSGR